MAAYNAAIRSRLNDLFATVGREARSPSKSELWKRIVGDTEMMRALLQAYGSAAGAPYDFASDPAAEYGRFLKARALAARFPLSLAAPADGWTRSWRSRP